MIHLESHLIGDNYATHQHPRSVLARAAPDSVSFHDPAKASEGRRPRRAGGIAEDPTSVWEGQVSELEVDVIPGDHQSIVTTEFEALAALLTDYVKQVSPQHV